MFPIQFAVYLFVFVFVCLFVLTAQSLTVLEIITDNSVFKARSLVKYQVRSFLY